MYNKFLEWLEDVLSSLLAYCIRFYRWNKKIFVKLKKFICLDIWMVFINFFLAIKKKIVLFFRNNPEYIDIDKKRTPNEIKNFRGVFWTICSFILWFDLLNTGIGNPKDPNYFVVWELYFMFATVYYFFYVPKGFRGLKTYTGYQFLWYGQHLWCFILWFRFMYNAFSWEEYKSSKKPFAYWIKLAHSTLNNNQAALWILFFQPYNLEELNIQFWRTLFLIRCWKYIYIMFEVFVSCVFGIDLWYLSGGD